MKTSRLATPILLLALLLLPLASRLQAQEPGLPQAEPIVIQAVKYDLSPPLRSIQPLAPQGRQAMREVPRFDLPRRSSTEQDGGQPDPVLQDWVGASNMPAPILSFEGTGNVNGVLPPDTQGDVGPDHYVQMVNISFQIWDKNGHSLYGPANNNTLWAGFGGLCETENMGDPIVLYDHLADRWLMSQFAFTDNLLGIPKAPFYQCIAISQSGDPTGGWYRYAFEMPSGKLNDYPKFGVWPDGYYMSVNQFACNNFDCFWGGQGAAAFERDRMLVGAPAQMVFFDDPDPALGGMLPSDLDGPEPPAGAPNYFIQVDDEPDQLRIWALDVDWTTPANSTFVPNTVLPTAPFDSNMCNFDRDCIDQPGTLQGVDAIADRLMYRLQYRNMGAYQTLVANHTVDVGGDQAGIRWYELRSNGGGWGVHQQGTYAPDGHHRWMGSAAMDKAGNIALGYSISSNTVYPSIRYTGRLAGDALGTLPQGEATIVAGGGVQTHNAARWGDYSMMSVDPDGCTFWYTQEYYASTSSRGWQTRIGAFAFPNCTPAGVQLTRFEAKADDPNIRVEWETASETDNQGFNLSRAIGDPNGNYVKLNTMLIPSQGQAGGVYIWTDPNVMTNTLHYYKLESVDSQGAGTFHGPVWAWLADYAVYLPLVSKH